MLWFTFINLITIIYGGDLFDSDIERKINATLQTQNISETALLLDLKTFVRDNGVSRNITKPPPPEGAVGNASKPGLRLPPVYYYPPEMNVTDQLLDLIRQAVYSTQERMLALDKVLQKYEKDPSLRMAFIFNRLKQLIIDMRRVYSVASHYRERRRVYEQIYWYSHLVRKYFDVLYIVEHVIDLFKGYAKNVLSKP